MECGICTTVLGSRSKPTCPSCARAVLYGPRLDQVKALLDKERLRKQIQITLKPPLELGSLSLPAVAQTVELTESAKKHEVERRQTQIETIDFRLDGIKEQQALLVQQIEEAKQNNARRKAENMQRRSAVEADRERFTTRTTALADPVQSESKRLEYKLGKTNRRMMQGRKQLCKETASLAGLLQRRRKAKDGSVREEYLLGGISVTDLRELNAAHPDHINASLANICRLLAICCHYLSVRLPAEVVLPHANFPHPAILSLQSSYQLTDKSMFAMTASAIHSPSSSRTLSARSARPKYRSLHLDKPLPRLAKEDPASYNLFVEGVTLLAWDIAWLCRSQGVMSINTFEDVCAIGKNLWELFVAQQSISSRVTSEREVAGHDEAFIPGFGEYSHGSSFKNLAGPLVTDLIRTWRLQSLAHISDRAKSYLLTEMSGAEWELLDEKEWNDDREDEQAVLVGGARHMLESRMAVSYMTAAGDANEQEGAPEDSNKPSSGWMKLKRRD